MRRALVFLLILALLGTAGLVYAHRAVAASAEAVEMGEVVICGDSSAARGIKARVPVYSGGHLFWDTETETGGEGAAVTEFRYTSAREGDRIERMYSALNVNVMTNMGAGGDFGKDFDFDERYDDFVDSYYAVYGDLLRDVASRTAAGEKHTEYAELTDWIDYLPLQFDFDLPGNIYVYDNGEESIETNRGFTKPLSQKLAEYFHIPLEGPAPVKVSVSRNIDGNIVDWNISSAQEGEDESTDLPGTAAAVSVSSDTWAGLNVGCLSVVTDGACYFVFDVWGSERENGRVDFSVLPGGRGVYRLPFEIGEYDNSRYHGSAQKATRVYLDEIETVLPVADGEYVELLDTDGERLLMFTVGNGKLYLTQAPLSDLTDVRRTELTDLAELEYGYDGYSRAARAEGLYYLETTGGRVLLLESVNGGEYGLVLDVPRDFPGAEESVESMLWEKDIRQSYDNYNSALLWDGGRFAIARWCGKDGSGFYGATAGFVLWVYDRTGLLYCGMYESSLSRAPTEMYDNVIRSAADLELAWK